MIAEFAVGETAGKAVVFESQRRRILRAAFQLQQRLFEVVVASGHGRGSGLHCKGEGLDHRLIGDHCAVLQVHGGVLEPGEHCLVIPEHHYMSLAAVLEVVMQAFFFAEALQEMQAALAILDAVVPWLVIRAEGKAIGSTEDAVAFQYLSDDLRHAQFLEYLMVETVAQIGKTGHQAELVLGQALACVALADAVNLAMNTRAVAVKAKERHAMQKAFQIQVGTFADQFQIKAEGLADGFLAGELKDLQIVVEPLDIKDKRGLVGRAEHHTSLVLILKGGTVNE